MDTPPRTPSPTDVSDDEWALLAPDLTLMRADAPQRSYALRDLFNGLRFIARTGWPWRDMPHDLPPWPAVYQQTRRWLEADVVSTSIADVRALIRLGAGRAAQPSATIFDSRTLPSIPESGQRAGWDGTKRKQGTQVHLASDPLGDLLARHVTPAAEQDRAHMAELAAAVQAEPGETVTLADVDHGDTGDEPQQAAAEEGIALAVVQLPAAKRGFVLLSRRWVIERDVAGRSRFRRLARDQDRVAEVLNSVHLIAFIMLMGKHVLPVLAVL